MNRLIPWVVAGALLLWGVAPVSAGPKNGIGLFGSYTSSSYTYSWNKENLCSCAQDFDFNGTGSGLGLGVDYQFAFGKRFSVLPFFEYAQQSLSWNTDLPSGLQPPASVSGWFNSAKHTYYGAQARIWFDSIFVGGQVGNYKIELSGTSNDNNFTYQRSSSTAERTTWGLVGGWEGDGGLFASLQYDAMSAPIDNPLITNPKEKDTLKSTTYRLNVGWRFK